MEPWFWTYGLICLLDPSGSNLVSRLQTPRLIIFLRYDGLIWFLISCLWKLEPEFWTYGLISRLGPNCPKLVFRTKTLNITVLASKIFFMSISIIFCITQALIFKFWVFSDKLMRVYSQKIAKKIQQKYLFFCGIPDL